MRLTFLVAFIAAIGASGVAVAIALPDVGVPVLASAPEPVLLVEPQAVAPAADAPDLEVPALAVPASRLAAPEPQVEVIRGIPRHLLLPDGALVSTLRPTGADAPLDGTLVFPAGLAPAPRPAVAPAIPTLDRRTETPGQPWELASESTPARAPVATQAARAFVPPEPEGRADPIVLWAGGLAAGAAALGIALYHRIRPHAALENETRKLIFDAVCATPGLGVHEISKIAGVSYSTATYHLERLIGAGMIVMTPDGNKLCYYKNGGAFSESERRILPLLKNEEAAKLFEAILAQPGTYRAALAEQLGVTATTINWHLRRLRDAGLVDETRAGRSAHLFARVDALRPTLLALASKVEPSEPTIAQRLRGYAVRDEPTGVGAA